MYGRADGMPSFQLTVAVRTCPDAVMRYIEIPNVIFLSNQSMVTVENNTLLLLLDLQPHWIVA
jgi:hypothetical protein